jgi:hypothetical protein
MWEDKRLRDVAEADVRQLVNSGLEEHLQLEYKSALYGNNHEGTRESLLDICMFANAGGGILLIGVSELRDGNGQPTGTPDPNAELGVDLPNPEMVLQSYDARVISNIQERLPLESFAIPVANNRHVVAIRVPNSMSKPHRVHLQGHAYFPSRRERQRYEMDVREIKEMVMRTASRLEGTMDKLSGTLLAMPRPIAISIIIGMIPAFWQNFMLDVRKPEVIQAVSRFHLGHANLLQPIYTYNGLQRQIVGNDDSFVQVHRDGMIILNRHLGLHRDGPQWCLRPTVIDIVLRSFVGHCSEVYTAASISGPFLLTMVLRTVQNTWGRHPAPLGEDPGGMIWPGDYPFPVMQVDNFLDIDGVILPLCDQTHQMFGRDASPNFNADGVWNR